MAMQSWERMFIDRPLLVQYNGNAYRLRISDEKESIHQWVADRWDEERGDWVPARRLRAGRKVLAYERLVASIVAGSDHAEWMMDQAERRRIQWSQSPAYRPRTEVDLSDPWGPIEDEFGVIRIAPPPDFPASRAEGV